MPRENENIRSKILQDLGSCILGIQDPRSFWDPGTCLEPGIFLWGAQPGRLIFLSDTAPLSKIICHLYREVIRNDDSRCALFGCTNPREAFQFFALRLGEDDKAITILVCTRRKKLSDKIVKTIDSHSLQCTYMLAMPGTSATASISRGRWCSAQMAAATNAMTKERS